MDFFVGFPKTTTIHDAICVIIDRLTKSVHFIPIRMTYSLEKFVELYVREVVHLHGVPKSIIICSHFHSGTSIGYSYPPGR